MLVTLENENCLCSIDSTGAELKRFYDKRSDDEILWQGNPEVWTGSAPVLFPVIGRIQNGKYSYDGKEYCMPKHGLVQKSEFDLVSRQSDKAVFVSSSSANTLKSFPFEFDLFITFTINDCVLNVDYCVRNRGNQDMLFSIGSHPAIDLHGEPTKYRIEFDRPQTLDCFRIENDLLTAIGVPYLNNESEIQITDSLFANDALIFKSVTARKIRIIDDSGKRVIEVDNGGAPDLGIWAKKGAGYVCIEPWFGYDDPEDCSGRLEEKPGILTLQAGQEFCTSYTIQKIMA